MGEPDKMALLGRLYARKALQARLYRRTRNREEADDLAQEVYLRLLKIADPKKVRNWEAYMFAVADNLLCREFACRARYQRGRVDLDDPKVQQELAELPAQADTVEVEKYARRLDEVMQVLSPKCRTVVKMRREGLTYKEIAGAIGISADMVKKYLKQVRARCLRPSVKGRYQNTRLATPCK
jgi:RNA polymerase sigma-70 factor (ECF subfamily)